jgi:hypothetical protein
VLFDSAEAPISFPQQLLHFLEYLRPGGAGSRFTLSTSLAIEGPLDVDALRWAVEQVTLRHDILRSVVTHCDGVSFQRVVTDEPATLEIIDPGGRDGADSDLTSELVSMAEAHEFSLDAPPLLRACLGCLGPDRHLLSLVVHHSVSDGWSLQVLERDVAGFYTARVTGSEPPKPLTWQYTDYARDQQETITGRRMTTGLRYWRERLAGVPAIRLPIDGSVASASASRKVSVSFEGGEELAAALWRFTQAENLTVFMVLLTAYKLLLHRLTGQEDIAVPTLWADRGRVETESMVGFFINGLLLRTRVEGGLSGRELLGRVRDTCVDAFEHSDVPLLRILEQVTDAALLLADDDHVIMPFQVWPLPSSSRRIAFGPDCSASHVERLSGSGELPLPVDGLITVWYDERRVAGTIDYSPELLSADHALAMARGLAELTGRLVEHPDRPAAWIADGLP